MTSSRLRWGLVSEKLLSPLQQKDRWRVVKSTSAAGVATPAPGLRHPPKLGHFMPVSASRGRDGGGGEEGTHGMTVCIVNPRGNGAPPLLVEKWRVMGRDFEEEALKALAGFQGDWLLISITD